MTSIDETTKPLVARAVELSTFADWHQEAEIDRENTKADAKASGSRGGFFRGRILRVHDGDTLIVQGPASWPSFWQVIAVRLLGIDAPELADHRADMAAKAKEARDCLERQMPMGDGTLLFRHVQPDKYGSRLLAVPLRNNVNLCEYMLQSGLAREYQGKGPKPW